MTEEEDNILSNSLFPRYSHSYQPANFNQTRSISSPILYSYTKVSFPYHPSLLNYNYPVTYPPTPYSVNSYAFNPSANNNHDKTNLVLIAILILASLDLIFVRPLKKNN